MSASRTVSSCRLLVALLTASCVWAAPRFDIPPSAVRQPIVTLAQKHSSPHLPPSLPADLRTVFNPPGFDQPDPEEVKAAAAAAAASAAEPKRPRNERELLALVAESITPSGFFVVGGEPILLISKKKYKVGDRIPISFEDRDIELEITAIDRSSFSLRLNRSEFTRPIKPGKTP